MSLFATYGIKAEVNITPTGGTETYVEINDGIENMSEAENEVVSDFFFLKDKGFGTSEVTGMHPVYTFTGKRQTGDAAQDYIFSPEVRYAFGEARKTKLKITLPDKTIVAPVVIANVQEFGGATTDVNPISFELRGQGKPTVTATI